MPNISKLSPETHESLRTDAYRLFGPSVLRMALAALRDARGPDHLDRFEKDAIRRIEEFQAEHSRLDDVKEFAVEQLYAAIRETKEQEPELDGDKFEDGRPEWHQAVDRESGQTGDLKARMNAKHEAQARAH